MGTFHYQPFVRQGRPFSIRMNWHHPIDWWLFLQWWGPFHPSCVQCRYEYGMYWQCLYDVSKI